jgi:hypothetical protein
VHRKLPRGMKNNCETAFYYQLTFEANDGIANWGMNFQD